MISQYKQYKAVRTQFKDGKWGVFIERISSERRNPDPFGNGPIYIYTVCEGIPPDKDYNTGGLAPTWRESKEPPFATNSAMKKAKRIALRLNTGDITEEYLTNLLRR